MKQTKQQIMQKLYDKLRTASEIPITERDDISSKGFYLSEHGNQEIYIKDSLLLKQKLHVLLHEYSHYTHFTHFYQDESRAECEITANSSAYLICQEFKLSIAKQVDLVKFSNDKDIINRLTATIQKVSGHILSKLQNQS